MNNIDRSSKTWSEIWNLLGKQTDLIIQQQLLAHHWAKNIRAGGDIPELHFRNLFQRILPEARYGVTSGHIVSPGFSKKPIVSPQCDMIIVDKLVPHSLLPFRSTEVGFDVVPIEAVVAIFEIKSNLTLGTGKNSLYYACKHLKTIGEKVQLTIDSTGSWMAGGTKLQGNGPIKVTGGMSTNPLIGVLSGKSSQGFIKPQTNKYFKEISKMMMPFQLDIVLSFDGKVIIPFEADTKKFLVDPKRGFKGKKQLYCISENNSLSRQQILARSLSIVISYINRTCGRHYNAEDYLFF